LKRQEPAQLLKLNLNPDAPKRESHEKRKRKKPQFYQLIVAISALGLVLILYKIYAGYQPPKNKIITVKKHEKEESSSPLSPSLPKIHPPKPAEAPIPITRQSITSRSTRSVHTNVPVQTADSSSATQTSKKPSTPTEDNALNSQIKVTLFPGDTSKLVRVRNLLKKHKITYYEKDRVVSLTFWRVVVPVAEKRFLPRTVTRIEELTRENTWCYRKGSIFYIAVSSMVSKKNANKLILRLKRSGFKTEIVRVTKPMRVKVLSLQVKQEDWTKIKNQINLLGAQIL